MSDDSNIISYQPTDGLSYDPSETRYWDPDALRAEIIRTFEVCHGCRMCFKFCDSFPLLFGFVDGPLDGDVAKIEPQQTHAVMEACFQCKLCEVQCPYTVRDGHEYQLDFPRLVHRYDAQHTRKHGITLQDRILGDPDRAGRMARLSGGLANVLNRVGAFRWLLEKVLGIHRRKQLPDFASEPFDAWARGAGLMGREPSGEVVLFQTCFVQHNEPQLGRDTVEVFQKNGVDLRCVDGLRCCGMPAWEHGDLDALQRQARHNLDLLVPFVENGARVVVINPTCSMMMRREYPELVAPEDRERAQTLAAAVQDVGEYLWSIRNEERFCTDFKSSPGSEVAYHAPCHLRAQGVGFKGRDLLRKIPGLVPTTTLECCGHDGTYAMTTRGFEASQRVGQRAFDGVQTGEAHVCATDCPLAATQFRQHAGMTALHPMTILARAYREDGFPDRVSKNGD